MDDFRLFRAHRTEPVPQARLRALGRAPQQDPVAWSAPSSAAESGAEPVGTGAVGAGSAVLPRDSAPELRARYEPRPAPDSLDEPPSGAGTVGSGLAVEGGTASGGGMLPSGKEASAPRGRLHERLHRWVPETLLTARFDPGRGGVLVLAGLTLVSLVVAATVLWRQQAAGEQRSPAAAPPLPPAASAPSATAETPEELVVSVVGRVHEPGLVTIESGDRVADALAEAGGALPDTDVTALNLARRLDDGEQLHVGIPEPEPPPGGNSAEEDSAVNLNSADEEALQQLPGVGEVTAQQIVRWRSEHGEFRSVDQLQDIDGIGEKTVQRLRELAEV
ncbi:helix-hairpin-helix domain-containing protein [Bounagaea algeriensis]